MPPKSVPGPSLVLPRLRGALRDEIERIRELDDEELFDLIEEMEQEVGASKDFRFHAPVIQRRQDFHLNMYRSLIRNITRMPADSTLEEVDAVCWPADVKVLCKQLAMFLQFVFKR